MYTNYLTEKKVAVCVTNDVFPYMFISFLKSIFFYAFVSVKVGSHATKAGLEFLILLPLSPTFQDYSHKPLCGFLFQVYYNAQILLIIKGKSVFPASNSTIILSLFKTYFRFNSFYCLQSFFFCKYI